MNAGRLTAMRTSALCCLLMCFFTSALQAQEFTHIVAFGDSFTDNGYIDGHGFNRDSNGKVWVEYLSDKLQAENLDNRAWGGARTDDGHYLGFDWSGLNWQIDRFELESKPEETLFTVWIGVNDYWDAKNDPADSVNNIERGLEKLIAKGAKHLVVLDIGSFMDGYAKKHDFAATPWRGSYAFPDPEKYLWYDEWHPMTQCHLEIAEMVHRVLQQ